MTTTTADTTVGQVLGEEIACGVVFRGIPYAEAPAGALRYCPPEPRAPWSDVRDCRTFGSVCPQVPASQMGGSLMMREDEPMDEDCLHLNVWTPAVDDGRRPTIVWFHGGGFMFGSGSTGIYDGASFARDGVVFVSVNYRLHALGYLYLDDSFEGATQTGNLGLLDQVAALRWVRDNIANFGGDPDNVTLAGQSAGAMSAATLMTSTAASGLFRRAIVQSGAGDLGLTTDAARRVSQRFLEILQVPAGDWDALRAVPASRIVETAMRVTAEAPTLLGDMTSLRMPFQPVIDGETLTAKPIERLQAGAAADVDVLVGTTSDEWQIFSFAMPPEAPEPDVSQYFTSSARSVEEVLEIYSGTRPGASRRDLLSTVETDHHFTIPAIRLAEAQLANGARAFVYRFAWRTPVLEGRLGACHTLEIPFAFEVLDRALNLVGEDAPQKLATALHGAWVRFASSGDPNGGELPQWRPYDVSKRPVLDLNDTVTLQNDPNGAVRHLWDVPV